MGRSGFCNFKMTNIRAAKTRSNKITTAIVRFKDFPKSEWYTALNPSAGIDKPPIISATILAIGINIRAGKKIIA